METYYLKVNGDRWEISDTKTETRVTCQSIETYLRGLNQIVETLKVKKPRKKRYSNGGQ